MTVAADSGIEAGEQVGRSEPRPVSRAWGEASLPRRIEVLPGERARPREESLQSKERASTGVDIWVREDRASPTVAGLPMRWMSSA